MVRTFSRSARLLAAAAVFSMAATPAMGQGWGGGWGGGGWGHRGHDRIDAGDVITGILILGTVAAIASAASNSGSRNRDRVRSRDDRDYRYRETRDDDYREQRDAQAGYGRDDRPEWQSGRGTIDSAVNACVTEVERGSRRVDTVDSVNRDGQGWRVTGQTSGGDPYSCAVDSSGQIRSATVNGTAA